MAGNIGPASPEGKTKVSRNSLMHGPYAKFKAADPIEAGLPAHAYYDG